VDRNNAKELALIAGTPADVAGAQPGQVALFTADQARKIALCNVVLEKGNRAEVAETYNLSAASTQEDILNGRTRTPIVTRSRAKWTAPCASRSAASSRTSSGRRGTFWS